MSTRTLLILFVVLIVVAAVAFLVNRQVEAPEQLPTLAPQAETVQFLAGVEMETVTRLDVRDESADRFISLLREPDGKWFQTQPTSTLAISQTLNNNVSGLLNLTSRRTLPAEENPLSAYGLDEPAYIITLAAQNEDGRTVRYVFHVGKQTAAGDAYYVQKVGDPRVYIVPNFSLDNLVKLTAEPPIPTPSPPISGTLPLSTTLPITP